MSLALAYEAVLGRKARRSDQDWQLTDGESARLAIALAVEHGARVRPGAPRPGRTGLRPPRGILTLWPGDLVARVGASTRVAELEEALALHGLALGLEVAEPDRTTLGACFAAARSGYAGPRGTHLRDRTLAVTFVDGRARLLCAGARVVKNVAGFDFGRLHHGAHGALGLILDLTVRLVPAPPARVAVWWSCEREDLATRLTSIRRQWGQDAVAEVLVDRVAAVRFGLPGPGLVFRQWGEAEDLERRRERSGGVDAGAAWERLLSRARQPGRFVPASSLSVADPGSDWVADLSAAVLRPAGGHRFLAPPAAAARSLKRVFDPAAIFPPLPGEERDS